MSEINKEFERGYDSAKQFMQSKLNACENLLQAERDRSEKLLKNLEDIIDGRVKLDVQYAVEAQLAEEKERSARLLEAIKIVTDREWYFTGANDWNTACDILLEAAHEISAKNPITAPNLAKNPEEQK